MCSITHKINKHHLFTVSFTGKHKYNAAASIRYISYTLKLCRGLNLVIYLHHVQVGSFSLLCSLESVKRRRC